LPDLPFPDRPQGGADPFSPPAGCVGAIAGAMIACLLAYVGIRVLSAESYRTTSIGLGTVVALGYVGLLVFSWRTRDATRRRFTRALLVTIPIVVAVVFAVLRATLSGAGLPV
jgi:hypothetical protein